MWKFITRGIRETLERRTCRTNVYSQSSQDNPKHEVKTNLTCQFLPPIFITCDKSFCGSARTTDFNFKKKQHNSKLIFKYSWLEAIGLSSVLTAGWIACQSVCLHKRAFERDNNKLKCKLSYPGFSHILAQILNLLPHHIPSITHCVGNDYKIEQDINSNAQKEFGPITLEQAFKQVGDEFTNTHIIIIGKVHLRHGIKALEEKRYKDALMHFAAGAKLSSPASIFNLGLCYELGIGTLADQKKAAKYYKDAAAYNHADALYNLGVFHAQGRGGLPIDIDIARTYFIRAAKLGHINAQHALDSEKYASQLINSNNTCTVPGTCLKNTDLEINATSNATNTLIDYKDSVSINLIAKSMCQIDTSKYNERIVEDPTTVFLDLLGLRESSPATIMATT